MSVEYFIGKNAKHNFELIDLAESHHIWFHVEGRPSCHVVAAIDQCSIQDRKALRQIIKRGAVLCKQRSKYASEKNLVITYARVSDVSKTDILGTVTVKNSKSITI
jgi:predicted ribosome quality control (RQC) complex YloA/Tae2 family protein